MGKPENQSAVFLLRLEKTYYNSGFFNVPTAYSSCVRTEEGEVTLRLTTPFAAKEIIGRIDRHANANMTARIFGHANLRDWFRNNFKLFDYVEVKFPSRDMIVLSKCVSSNVGGLPSHLGAFLIKRKDTAQEKLQESPSNEGHIDFSSRKKWKEFEEKARRVMREYYGCTTLLERNPWDFPKKFDFVSKDEKTIGDAKYLQMLQGGKNPPGKLDMISAHVWLLEKTNAERKFLVFGNQKDVIVSWLKKYGKLNSSVDIFFLDDNSLQKLN